MCAKRRLRSAWASAQSDQSLRCASDQPGHLPSLIRIFAVHSRTQGFFMRIAKTLSDWADARADQSLRWAHMPFCWFCHEAAHFSCDGIFHSHLSPVKDSYILSYICQMQGNVVIHQGVWESSCVWHQCHFDIIFYVIFRQMFQCQCRR